MTIDGNDEREAHCRFRRRTNSFAPNSPLVACPPRDKVCAYGIPDFSSGN